MPNKATSKSQFRLFKGIAEGTIPEKDTLTKAKAAEMVAGQTTRGLPEKKALGRLVSRIKKSSKKRFKIG